MFYNRIAKTGSGTFSYDIRNVCTNFIPLRRKLFWYILHLFFPQLSYANNFGTVGFMTGRCTKGWLGHFDHDRQARVRIFFSHFCTFWNNKLLDDRDICQGQPTSSSNDPLLLYWLWKFQIRKRHPCKRLQIHQPHKGPSRHQEYTYSPLLKTGFFLLHRALHIPVLLQSPCLWLLLWVLVPSLGAPGCQRAQGHCGMAEEGKQNIWPQRLRNLYWTQLVQWGKSKV